MADYDLAINELKKMIKVNENALEFALDRLEEHKEDVRLGELQIINLKNQIEQYTAAVYKLINQ